MTGLKLSRPELRLFLVLLTGCVLGSVLVLPYLLHLQGLSEADFPKMALLSAINSSVIYSILIYLGILLKRQVAVAGAPFIEGKTRLATKDVLLSGITPGLAAWILIVLGELAFRSLGLDMTSLEAKQPPAIYGFLASFYGGIVEEVSLRFFLMGLIAWPLRRLGNAGLWTAILVAAFAFGAGHLPATAKALQVSTVAAIPILLIIRVIALNMIVGSIAGWLYWKKGLEFAVLAHFTADIGLHVLQPIISR